MFLKRPVLIIYKLVKFIVIKTNINNFVFKAVISQLKKKI